MHPLPLNAAISFVLQNVTGHNALLAGSAPDGDPTLIPTAEERPPEPASTDAEPLLEAAITMEQAACEAD